MRTTKSAVQEELQLNRIFQAEFADDMMQQMHGLKPDIDYDLIHSSSDGFAGLPQRDEVASTSEGSSSPRWPSSRRQSSQSGLSSGFPKTLETTHSFMWEEKREKRETELSEVEMMKERFVRLLLGEDMSGAGNGLCTASAISNAITDLAASVFGQLWRLEPVPTDNKAAWQREMEWILSVSDHIVELIPSWHNFDDGSNLEVMVSRPCSDLHVNLLALRKLDTMLLETLDSFQETEFWYVDQGIVVSEKEGEDSQQLRVQRQEGKWWLPSPKVPMNGLTCEACKQLLYQREATNQILKAALSIKEQALSEMEVPEVYWKALPKNGKSILGETIYRALVSEKFSPESVLSLFDVSSEHSPLGHANNIEGAMHAWKRKIQSKHHCIVKDFKSNAKYPWGRVKELFGRDKHVVLTERAESVLRCLRQGFPGVSQTMLDMKKIQYNRDVGKSILERYSKVLETLASNIIIRIDDILFIDDLTRCDVGPIKRGPCSYPLYINTPYAAPFASPSTSPCQLSKFFEKASSSIFVGRLGMLSKASSRHECPTSYSSSDTNLDDSDRKDRPRSPTHIVVNEKYKSCSHVDMLQRDEELVCHMWSRLGSPRP